MQAFFARKRLVEPATLRGRALLAWKWHWIWPRRCRASLVLLASAAACATAMITTIEYPEKFGEYFHVWKFLVLGPFVLLLNSMGGPSNGQVRDELARVVAMLPLDKSQVEASLQLRQFILVPTMTLVVCMAPIWLFSSSLQFTAMLLLGTLLVLFTVAMLGMALGRLRQPSPQSFNLLPAFCLAYIVFVAVMHWRNKELGPISRTLGVLLLVLAVSHVVERLIGLVRKPLGEEAVKFIAPPDRRKALAILLDVPVQRVMGTCILFGALLFMLDPQFSHETSTFMICAAMILGVGLTNWRGIARAIRPLPVSSAGLACLLLLQSFVVAIVPGVMAFILYIFFQGEWPNAFRFAGITFVSASFLWMAVNTIRWFGNIYSTGSSPFFVFLYFSSFPNRTAKALDWDWRHDVGVTTLCLIGAIYMAYAFYSSTLRDSREFKHEELDIEGDVVEVEDPDASVSALYLFAGVLLLSAIALSS